MSKEQIKNIIDNNSQRDANVGRHSSQLPQKTARQQLL
jgi:hypothetical protein